MTWWQKQIQVSGSAKLEWHDGVWEELGFPTSQTVEVCSRLDFDGRLAHLGEAQVCKAISLSNADTGALPDW